MAKACDLCAGETFMSSVCKECQRKLTSGFHPFVCRRCRDIFGVAQGTTWVHRDLLSPETTEALYDQERRVNGSAAFIVGNCKTCEVIDEKAFVPGSLFYGRRMQLVHGSERKERS